MIPNRILEKVVADTDQNKEVVRLAYEIAFEGRLKEPNESSLEFTVKRMNDLQKLFRRCE